GAALRAEDLNALVIAVNCLTGVVDDANRAVLKLQGDDGGINVAGLANARVNQDRADCMDLGDLRACQEAGHIEVVDHHVVEDAAGDLDIGYRGRLRVAGGDLHDVDLADLAV